MNGDSPFDPANTYSGTLPTLPPDYRAVLDPRFPIEWTLQSRLWQDAIRAWEGRPAFVLEEVARATQQDTVRKMFPERRFVQPPPPAPGPPPPPPVPYPALEQTALDDDWDTATRTAVLAGSWPGRRRGANGRFIAAGGDD